MVDFNVTVNIYNHVDAETREQLDEVQVALAYLVKNVNKIIVKENQQMVTAAEIKARIAETLQKVAACGTRIDSIDALMDGYRQQIIDLMAAAGASEEIMEGVNLVFAEAMSVTAKADAAINENTVPDGPPPPPVDPTV